MKVEKSKKELREKYKDRKVVGGVYLIRNSENSRILICSTADLQSSINRFEFAKKTGSCVDLKLQGDWSKCRGASFNFEVLEELNREETQTANEFMDDILVLKNLWMDKLSDQDMY